MALWRLNGNTIIGMVTLFTGNVKKLDNLTHVSLLPITRKYLEFFMTQRIMEYLDANGPLIDKPMGFRKERSTTDGCLRLVDENL